MNNKTELRTLGSTICLYQDLGEELDAMSIRISADSELQVCEEEVRRCMVSKGVAFDTFETAETELHERLTPIIEGINPFETLTGVDEGELTAGQAELMMADTEISDASLQQLRDLPAWEIELAGLLISCDGDPDSRREVRRKGRDRLESEFIDKCGDRLEAYASGK